LEPIEPDRYPEAKKSMGRPSALKREVLARLGKYPDTKPRDLQGRIMKKLSRNRYRSQISVAKPVPEQKSSRFYILVLQGDTVSGLARI
jgi:hypothetical protein